MGKKTTTIATSFLIIIIIAGFVFYSMQSILPELDNKITYFDDATDVTQLVQTTSELTHYENDKFDCYKSGGGDIGFDGNVPVTYMGGSVAKSGGASCITKKDFARLKTYIRVTGNKITLLSGYQFITLSTLPNFDVFEIIPDNLNADTYDIFRNGIYLERITTPSIRFNVYVQIIDQSWQIDYIKFTQDDTYTIKNDEVWVKEVRGSVYAYKDLNWEMIGFHSEIRPATIRDLTAQTEKPAPQIYINLRNNLSVEVSPNTIHTFYYRTKWTQGLDSSCQGQLDKVEVKGSDGLWHCESYVKETPIIQQCQTKADCPILPECESQKELISCNNNLCDFTAFSPACKNQLITYQEKVTEIENTKFVPIISGTNSFYCFFDKTSSSCQVGEKTISMSSPSYACQLPSDSSTIVSSGTNPECWKSSLSFLGQSYEIKNNQIISNIGSNIKAEISISASLDSTRNLRDTWGIAGKFTLPDNFLDIKPKSLGNKLEN